MSIDAVREGIENVIKKIGGFDSSNVRTGDFSPLDSGNNKVVVIEYMPSSHGQPGEPPARMGQHASNHNWRIRVYQRLNINEGDAYIDLLQSVDDVIAELNKYRMLNATSGVRKALVTSTGEIFVKQPEPYFLYLDITLEVIESVTPSFAE